MGYFPSNWSSPPLVSPISAGRTFLGVATANKENQDVRDLDPPRDGPAMTTWLATLPVMLLIIAVLGVYDLQRWLERWDHDRHLSD